MKTRAYRTAMPLLALLAATSSASGSIFSYSGSIQRIQRPTMNSQVRA
ncbi:MAG: hypothetical protein ACLPM3_15060 [Terracidiphilus sp.]